ncbi:MAG: class I SAM-dependent methyltransferase [archaeon]|nr:class I SAM-dependent methyltransferase [archaeon]
MSDEINSIINRDSFRKKLNKYTQKAFELLPMMEKPKILDVGCGSGEGDILLAKISDAKIIGIDNNTTALSNFDEKIKKMGLTERIEILNCSFTENNFEDESFDIIWSEGSLNPIGYEIFLKTSYNLVKKERFLVIHEQYNRMSNKLGDLSKFGYKLLDQFLLPADAWWLEYYKPLETHIKNLKKKYKENLDFQRKFEEILKEIDMVKNNQEFYRSAIFILQKIKN